MSNLEDLKTTNKNKTKILIIRISLSLIKIFKRKSLTKKVNI